MIVNYLQSPINYHENEKTKFNYDDRTGGLGLPGV